MPNLDSILAVISHHTGLAYGAIFLISLAESLALIGLLVPGTVIMFGVGAVVATGTLGLASALLLAMAGAIAGDGISFWLGHHYKERLTGYWPFSRYPKIMKRGRDFFHHHGGKSILFGRFVGPVRPVIPVVAGMLGMGAVHFTLVNILSAIGWALVYILPGVFFGASLTVAGAISTRLATVIFILLVCTWGFIWLCRRMLSLFTGKGPAWFEAVEKWSAAGSQDRTVLVPLKRFFSFLCSRHQSEAVLFVFLTLVLVFAGWGFLGVLQDVLARDPLVMADQGVFHFFQSVRTVWGDRFFVAITELGDASVYIILACAVTAVLLLKRCYRAAGFWVLTALGGFLGVQLLKLIIHTPRPVALYHGASSYSFPSGHTTMTVILYGFLAILLARELAGTWRVGLFSSVILIGFMVGFSRLYLGAHWLSDVLGGYFIGMSWAAMMGMTYLKKAEKPVPRRLLVTVVFLAISGAGGWHIAHYHEQDMAFYAPRPSGTTLSLAGWESGAWRNFPARRMDMEGELEQPFTVQWAGDPAILTRYLLEKEGWLLPRPMDLKTFLWLFSPAMPVEKLPVLPRLHDGRTERLRLVRGEGDRRLVFRLWATGVHIKENGAPLFIGTIEEQHGRSMAGLITLVRDTREYEQPLRLLEQQLRHSPLLVVRRVRRQEPSLGPDGRHNGFTWQGSVLLLWQNTSEETVPILAHHVQRMNVQKENTKKIVHKTSSAGQ